MKFTTLLLPSNVSSLYKLSYSIPSLKFIDDENFIICLGDEPTIYTRVSKFWNWIQTHIGDDYCPLV